MKYVYSSKGTIKLKVTQKIEDTNDRGAITVIDANGIMSLCINGTLILAEFAQPDKVLTASLSDGVLTISGLSWYGETLIIYTGNKYSIS